MADPASKIILFKIETTEQTDAAPTAAANAILTRNFTPRVLEGDVLERPLDLPGYGSRKAAFTAVRGGVSFDVECAGSGAAGTIALWAQLLQASGCAAAQSLLTPTRCEQKALAAGQPFSSATLRYAMDNSQRALIGARGNGFSFTAEAAQYPTLSLDFMGLLPASPFTDGALAAPVLTGWREPVEVGPENSAFTLDGHPAPLRRLRVTMNKQRELRRLVNQKTVRLGNHTVEWEALIELPLFATRNYYAKALDRTVAALSFTNGTVAGNIIKLDLPNAQINAVSESEETGSLMTLLSGQATIVNGADDFLFTTS